MIRGGKKEKNGSGIFFLLLLALVLAFTASSLYFSRYGLQTTNYTVSDSEISAPFCIVQLSDNHGTLFGKDNVRLIEKVSKEKPDLILITGDLINAKAENLDDECEKACDLIKNLVQIAPVYISYGNHEANYDNGTGRHIADDYRSAGAVVLETEYMDIEVNGQKIRIGGIYGYCLAEIYAHETKREDESEFIKDFLDTDLFTILLCHMPVGWLSSSLYDWDVDCVFAGHAHGGQIQIPIIGGVWAPDQGWFPGKEYGLYATTEKDWIQYREKMIPYIQKQIDKGVDIDISRYDVQEYETSRLVLSRGLGSAEKIPRFNNIPEIVVTHFTSGEK